MVYVKKGFEFEDTYDIYSRIPSYDLRFQVEIRLFQMKIRLIRLLRKSFYFSE